MGRPKGSLNGMRKTRSWEPVKWRVDHEIVVLMHCSGKSNKEIADQFSKTEVWVGLVLSSNKAKQVIEKIRGNLPVKDIEGRLGVILDKAIGRMESFVDDDELYKKNPGPVVDRAIRMAEMIKGSTKEKKEDRSIINNTLVLASEASIDRLIRGLDRSQEVTNLHRIASGE